MKLMVVFATLLVFIKAFANDEPKFKVRCRKLIHGTFHVDKFDDWQIVVNEMESQLSGVSIIDAKPPVEGALPDDYTGKGKMSGTWSLKKKSYWLVCHHPKLKMVIEQKLPDGLFTCKATEVPDAVNIECK